MRIRVIDYVANPGGGVRFATELLIALATQRPHYTFELVSYGSALERYRVQLLQRLPNVVLIEAPPANRPRLEYRRWHSLPGATLLPLLAGKAIPWHIEIPSALTADCDVAWLPWMHRHKIPESCRTTLVATFHDAISLRFPKILSPAVRECEFNLTRDWLRSAATLSVTSHATATTVSELFNGSPARFSVIRLCGTHASHGTTCSLPADWHWAAQPFLLCPANITPHKNHDVLLRAFAKWSGRYPLVLTGDGTALLGNILCPRTTHLRRTARSLALLHSDRLIRLGYVTNEIYYSLLSRAWALVMPTLAEGGGSFPVMEAQIAGIPVLCSDIPVLREQFAHIGGTALWFDPAIPDDLTRQLEMLLLQYPWYLENAKADRRRIHCRTWNDVANDYDRLFKAAANAAKT